MYMYQVRPPEKLRSSFSCLAFVADDGYEFVRVATWDTKVAAFEEFLIQRMQFGKRDAGE